MSGKQYLIAFTVVLFCVVGCGTHYERTEVTSEPATSSPVSASCKLVLTADNANISSGSTISIHAKTAGCTNDQIYWAVDGVIGGNAQDGTISSSGLYSAPLYPPVSGQVTVSASSNSDMSNAGTILINVFYLIPASSQRLVVNRKISQDFFGMHMRCSGNLCNSSQADLTAIRFGSMRLWDNFHWAKLEPHPGVFNFESLDQFLEVAKRQGIDNFIFTLGNPPSWAAANQDADCTPSVPGTTCQVPDMDALDQFLHAFVQHYCGKISTYEFWNEPDQLSWTDTVGTSILIAKHVASIAHSTEDCGCSEEGCGPNKGANQNLVAGPAIGYLWNTKWLKRFLAAGGGNYLDVNTVHTYGYLYTLSSFLTDYDAYSALLQQYNQANKPLWDTETDWGTTDPARPQSDNQLASWMIKFLVLNAAKGMHIVGWYAYNNCLWGTLWGPRCGTNADNYQGLRKPGVAYRELYKWLTGTTLQYCDLDGLGDVVCRLTRDSSYDAWIIWAGTGSEVNIIKADTPLSQVRDQNGNAYPLPEDFNINSEPVLIETSAAW